MLVEVVISVDTYSFLLSQACPVTLRIQEQVFYGCTVPPDIKETEFGSSNQEASPSVGKYTGVVLLPCCTWKCTPTAIFGGVDIPEISRCSQ